MEDVQDQQSTKSLYLFLSFFKRPTVAEELQLIVQLSFCFSCPLFILTSHWSVRHRNQINQHQDKGARAVVCCFNVCLNLDFDSTSVTCDESDWDAASEECQESDAERRTVTSRCWVMCDYIMFYWDRVNAPKPKNCWSTSAIKHLTLQATSLSHHCGGALTESLFVEFTFSLTGGFSSINLRFEVIPQNLNQSWVWT